jgi:hypothetical protein
MCQTGWTTGPSLPLSVRAYSGMSRWPMAAPRRERDALRVPGAATLPRPSRRQEKTMLYTIALVLVMLWVLGLAMSFTAGGLLHILLAVAVIMVLYRLITGRSAV